MTFIHNCEFWLRLGEKLGCTPGRKETAFAFHQRVKHEIAPLTIERPISFKHGRNL